MKQGRESSDSSRRPKFMAASRCPFVTDRAVGLLVGLCVGDTNGGPLQMALALAEALATDGGAYIPEHVLTAYLRWWDCGRGTDAWDTGPTTESVFTSCAPAAVCGPALLELALSKVWPFIAHYAGVLRSRGCLTSRRLLRHALLCACTGACARICSIS
jgi:hypothetical protein